MKINLLCPNIYKQTKDILDQLEPRLAAKLIFGNYIKQNKSSGNSKTLQPKSSAKTKEPTVQVKSKKKAKNISMALEVAMKRDSSNEVKRDYTWERSSEDDI